LAVREHAPAGAPFFAKRRVGADGNRTLKRGDAVARHDPSNISGRLWVEEGEQHVGMIAEVAPLVRTDRTYSYAVPDEMARTIQLGQRVEVPLGRAGRPVVAFVVALDEKPWDSTLRPVARVVDEQSFLPPDLIGLGREISQHYACPLGRTLKAVTPEGVRLQRGLKRVRYARLVGHRDPEGEARRLGPKQAAIVAVLEAAQEAIAVDLLLAQAGASSSVLRALATAGIVEVFTQKELAPHDSESSCDLHEPEFTLNDEQEAALAGVLEAVEADKFSVSLLYGVAGSGKTEVYIHAMRRVVASGKQAILLVPEIVLTTQLVQRLARRFPDVALNHSGLTDSRRSILWRARCSLRVRTSD